MVFPSFWKKIKKPQQTYDWDLLEEDLRKRKSEIQIAASVSICSLRKKAGCSHFTYSLGNWLNQQGKKVYVVTHTPAFYQEAEFPCGNAEPVWESYDHVLHDFGCIAELTFDELKEIRQTEEKFMLCLLDHAYITKLAEFVQNDLDFTKSWRFLFNHVPTGKRSEVADLMETYQFTCLPEYGKGEGRILEKVLHRVGL